MVRPLSLEGKFRSPLTRVPLTDDSFWVVIVTLETYYESDDTLNEVWLPFCDTPARKLDTLCSFTFRLFYNLREKDICLG